MSLSRLQFRMLITTAGTKKFSTFESRSSTINSSNYLSLTNINIKKIQQPKRSYSIFLTKKNEMTFRSNMKSRNLATQEITKNIQLFSDKPINVDRDPVTLKLKQPLNKPMVLMLSWLLAKQAHLAKYAKLYTDEGYDVLCVAITPWQLLWPAKGSQIVAKDTLKFLESNPNYNPLIVHGFSVGAYVFGECLVHMTREFDRFKPVSDRIIGQIWDSVADITEIPIGVPKAVFPKNKTLETTLNKYMLYHLKVFHEQATSHYIRSSQMFYSSHLRAPGLMLLSKTDPVGAEASNNRVRESWESLGIRVVWKCWDKSGHVAHFTVHREEYLEELSNFLRSLNMPHLEKIQACSKL